MKKIISIFILTIVLILSITTVVLAEDTIANEQTDDIVAMKNNVKEKIAEYTEQYESESYGLAAYILNVVRIFSIPVCFVGIVIGALNQYVLGTRRLDRKHKGYGIIMTFVTLLVICQVLPLIFTIVVIGWRG